MELSILTHILFWGKTELLNFDEYEKAQANIRKRYEDRSGWARMCLLNIAQSGYFSSDRTIEEYVRDIWHIEKINVK